MLIRAHELSAIRGERILYRQKSLDVRTGEIVLLRGANGTGKTTLLRQLAGLSESPTGSVVWVGDFHWIGHTNGLKAHETPRSHLQHWARVWGSDAVIDDVLAQMALRRPADVPSRLLSAGQKRRTALGRLLLVPRSLWLLDEPFNALDSAGQDLLTNMITAHCETGGVIAALHGEAPITATEEVLL